MPLRDLVARAVIVLSLDRFGAVSLPGHANNSKRVAPVYCGQLLRAQSS